MKKLPAARLFLALILIALLAFSFQNAYAQAARPLVLVLKANGEVAPAMRDYIARGLKAAENQKAELVVIELNTPGGFIVSMDDIVTNIRASGVPVVVYVTPSGGMAGSAGTLITLAGHAAAMSPETIIGAASPVGAGGQELDSTVKAKEIEALTALVRSMAGRRSPEAIKLAEDTIKSARAVSALEAKSVQLVDFIAIDLTDLLTQLNGFSVMMGSTPRVLHTANAVTSELLPDLGELILDALVRTDTVFLLMALGLLAILIELSSPGGWVAGFIGVVALALAVYGLGILTVNWFGVIFLVLAFALFTLDIKTPTHGALTAAGIGSFILGALVLFNSPGVPEFQRVSVPLVVFVALVMGLSFAAIIGFALRAQRTPLSMGRQTLIGAVGLAKGDIDPRGQVQLNSELWSAELAEGVKPVQSGDKVVVVGIEGLRLKVRKGSKQPD
jgi:membrane-bound serine protease (ClpP class)